MEKEYQLLDARVGKPHKIQTFLAKYIKGLDPGKGDVMSWNGFVAIKNI